jgi:hypothetical protein
VIPARHLRISFSKQIIIATIDSKMSNESRVGGSALLTSDAEFASSPTSAERTTRTFIQRSLLAVGVTLGAFLLFSGQLILNKYILPWFGGTAGVWTTSLLFFQTTLLAGYLYAHASVSKLALKDQAKLHSIVLLISLAAMAATALLWPSPITPGASWKPRSGEIAVWLILRLLLVSVGATVTLLSTTGPLMQHWFTRVSPGESPYRLYALSNVGSLLGLLSYPAIVERMLRLHTQAWVWCAGYAVYAVSTIVCARMCAASDPRATVGLEGNGRLDESAPPSYKERTSWLLLAALGSLMLVATTHFITEDLAPVPLLWVLPLAIYLISFIVCFDHPRWYRQGLFHFFLLATTGMTILFYGGLALRLWMFVAVLLGSLFACCSFCHGELYRRRPQPAYLTSFYLMIALGGVLGSAFANLVAPLLFKGNWEMQLGTAACLFSMAAIAIRDKTSWLHRKNPFIWLALLAWTLLVARFLLKGPSDSLVHFVLDWRSGPLAAVALVCALLAFRPPQETESTFVSVSPRVARWCLSAAVTAAAFVTIWFGTREYRESVWAHRNFYGDLYIQEKQAADPNLSFYVLTSRRTYHGAQLIAPQLQAYPTTYFSKNSGIGLTLMNYPRGQDSPGASRSMKVGIIGLGVGTLATYGLPGDVFRFYEIDPETIHVAWGRYGYFSFLARSQARIEIVQGDARISLERELANGEPQDYDALVVDAFNGDLVPFHLLTKEAFELYLKHLRGQDSVIAVHVSNRTMDLASVIAKEAEHFHLRAAYVIAPGNQNPRVPDGLFLTNHWILLSRTSRVLSLPAISQVSGPIPVRHDVPLWTDDHSNLLQILR